MNFKVNIKVCRVCMKSEEGYSLFRDQDLHSKFVFTTRLSLKPGDSMPGIICPKCALRLKVSFEFIQLAHASEKNLKAFLAKISSDFEQVTKTTCSSTSSPILEHYEDEDDVFMMFNETAEDTSSTLHEFSEPIKEAPKPETKIKSSVKILAPVEASSPFKLETVAQKKQIVKQETTEFIINSVGMSAEEDEVVYYEEANFLDDSETEEMDHKQLLNVNKSNDGNYLNDEELTPKTAGVEHQQINGYLEEYNAMLAEQDASSCNGNFTKQFKYGNSTEDEQEGEGEEILEDQEDQVEITNSAAAEEVLHLYDDTEDLMPEENLLSAEITSEQLKRREHINEETLEIAEESIIAESDVAHPIELKPTTILETNIKQTKSSTQQKQSPAVKPRKLGITTSNSSINARFFCVRCNRDFSTKTNLTRHMATHEGIKPYKCPECNKSFSQNGSLKQHMYTHTGEKPFVCEVCNRGFTQCKSLVFHSRRHTGEKPFPCEHCGTFFRQKDGLKTHILKHHMIRKTDGDTETHICDICKKLLATKYALQVHMKKHVNNHKMMNPSVSSLTVAENTLIDLLSEEDLLNDKSFIHDELALNIDDVTSSTQILDTMTANTAKASRAKKFQCRKCFKCFAIKKNLLRHLTTHDVSASELFQCQTCQVAFDTNYALKVHRVREHKETGINLNECEHCNITFTNANELSQHNSSVHDATDQKCPECPDLHFKTQKQLFEHLMEHESLSNEVDDE